MIALRNLPTTAPARLENSLETRAARSTAAHDSGRGWLCRHQPAKEPAARAAAFSGRDQHGSYKREHPSWRLASLHDAPDWRDKSECGVVGQWDRRRKFQRRDD